MHFIEMVTWLVGLPCYHLSNESNTLNTNIAVNNVKYINVMLEMLILSTTLFLGMLPLHGSYTSNPEEELEELRMKLQSMKGEWKNSVKLTLMVKLNQEWF